jgi:hypothetical protein
MANTLLAKCAAQVKAARASEIVNTDNDYLAARIAAMRGDRATALVELKAAVDRAGANGGRCVMFLLGSMREELAGSGAVQENRRCPRGGARQGADAAGNPRLGACRGSRTLKTRAQNVGLLYSSAHRPVRWAR